jgi:endonuclease YncB( thermonuclease family)
MALAVTAIASGTQLACVPQETIAGRATVTDGDSLEIGATRVRLFGIDAPEGRQPCLRNGGAWRCGEEAARKLRTLVRDASLRCTQQDIDDYGRIVAVCRNGSIDIGAEMVRSGLALAYRQYSRDYVDEESEARSAQRGVWAGEFTPPWDWRRDPQATAAPRAQAQPAQREATGCSIKGNISFRGERIYHVPGSASYRETIIDEDRGERWFCSEDEARSAGWRPPGARAAR